MFFDGLKAMMAARAARRAMAQQVTHRLLLQVQAPKPPQTATTQAPLSAVALLLSQMPWLPARQRFLLQQAMAAQLLHLRPLLPTPSRGSRKSTASSGKTARRSTSKRRRAR